MNQTDAALSSRIAAHFEESARLKLAAAAALTDPVARAGRLFARSLKAGNKAMACGNGGSAADSQHFVAELINRFERERPPLAAVALTTGTSTPTPVPNHHPRHQGVSEQLRAAGPAGDGALAVSAR